MHHLPCIEVHVGIPPFLRDRGHLQIFCRGLNFSESFLPYTIYARAFSRFHLRVRAGVFVRRVTLLHDIHCLWRDNQHV
jgi:hypothetical protein